MKILELFAGTRSISKAFENRGHETFTIELDKNHPNISFYGDINKLSSTDILNMTGHIEVIWASPPCTSYSIAGISHHRYYMNGELTAYSPCAIESDKLLKHTIELIREIKPKYWFIENPRGGLRKMDFMQELVKYRYTITYCQYGNLTMKPTDIWTNHPNPQFKPMCKNGDPCHIPSPRGSVFGIQGMKGSVERSIIPPKLCEHIVDICEE